MLNSFPFSYHVGCTSHESFSGSAFNNNQFEGLAAKGAFERQFCNIYMVFINKCIYKYVK